MEEVFANQLVSMVKGMPFGDLFQEASASPAPVSLMHQENSQRALKVGYTMSAPEGIIPHDGQHGKGPSAKALSRRTPQQL